MRVKTHADRHGGQRTHCESNKAARNSSAGAQIRCKLLLPTVPWVVTDALHTVWEQIAGSVRMYGSFNGTVDKSRYGESNVWTTIIIELQGFGRKPLLPNYWYCSFGIVCTSAEHIPKFNCLSQVLRCKKQEVVKVIGPKKGQTERWRKLNTGIFRIA
jgi:hypothetical protein